MHLVLVAILLTRAVTQLPPWLDWLRDRLYIRPVDHIRRNLNPTIRGQDASELCYLALFVLVVLLTG